MRLLLAVTIVAAMPLLATAQSQPPTPATAPASQEQQQQPDSQQPNAGESPTISPTVIVPPQQPQEPPPATAPTENTSDKDQQPPPDWVTWASGLSNVVIALVTIALAWVAWKQAGYMRDGLIETRKAADAAAISAQVAQDTLHMTQRAVIALERVEYLNSVGFVEETRLGLVFRNAGPTLAKKLRIGWGLGAVPDTPVKYPDNDVEITVAPNEPIRVSRNRPIGLVLGTDLFTQVVNGAISLYFTAEVTYSDIFDQPHVLSASGVFEPAKGTFAILKSQST